MKKYSRRAVNIALASTALIGAIPLAGAVENAQDSSSQITKFWKRNSEKYGKAVSDETCFSNTACSQEFENAIITWNKRNGASALTDAESISTFKAAGGAETLGALEGGSFKHSFCGTSVTTYNNSTRYLLVLDGAQQGQSLDLNSDTAKKWKQERKTTKACFTAEKKSDTPTDLNWSEADYLPGQEALVLTTDTSAYVRQADGQGQAVAGSVVYEVPWLKGSSEETMPSAQSWKSFSVETSGLTQTMGSTELVAGLGLPTSAPEWKNGVATQSYTYGTASWSGDSGVEVKLNLEGANRYLKTTVGLELAPQTENIYVAGFANFPEDWGGKHQNFVYDSESGKLVYMNDLVFGEYMKSPEKYGAVYASAITAGDDDERYGYDYGSFVTFRSGNKQVNLNNKNSSSKMEYTVSELTFLNPTTYTLNEISSEVVDIANPTDPDKVDWSKATYYEQQHALVYIDGSSYLIVKADASGKAPASGAKAYRSYFAIDPETDDGVWFYFWFSNSSESEIGALGLPIADANLVEENGSTIITQEFEGGTLRWDSANPVITLNDLGKSRVKTDS